MLAGCTALAADFGRELLHQDWIFLPVCLKPDVMLAVRLGNGGWVFCRGRGTPLLGGRPRPSWCLWLGARGEPVSPPAPRECFPTGTHTYLFFFPCFLLLRGPHPTWQQAVGPLSFRRWKPLKDQLLPGQLSFVLEPWPTALAGPG